METKRKYVLISGATSGFGLACAEIFSKNGWDLIITGRRSERLALIKEDLNQLYPSLDVITLCFDIRNNDEVNENINSLSDSIKSNIHILLNNAGLALDRNPIDKCDTNDWDQMIDTNVKGLLYLTKAISPYLISNKSGHIINLGSIAGKEVYPEGNVYCATKHAVDALSKAMRMDFVKHNIKVTNIAPGAADTEFSNVRFKGDEQVAKAVYVGYEPLKAEDIAETIYFVATRPPHVNINDITIMPTAQASSTVFNKKL
jgi:3-hydroxy acid dehydrogenase / malonic semialdehyde reductase